MSTKHPDPQPIGWDANPFVGFAVPQLGQDFADVLTSRPHSRQGFSAIITSGMWDPPPRYPTLRATASRSLPECAPHRHHRSPTLPDDINAWLVFAGIVLGPTGAVWATVRASLNGVRRDVKETRADCREIRTTLATHGERIARIESRIEAP